MELTPREQEAIDFIKQHVVERGYPPSLRELADHFDTTSVSWMHHLLESLKRKGAIEREPGKPRAIKVNV